MHLVVNAVASISLILICLQDNICFGITDNTTIQSTTLEKSDLKSNENEPNNGTATAITMTFVFLGIAVVLAVLYKRRLFGVRDIMDQFFLKLTKCCYHTEETPSTGTDDPTTEDGNEEGVETSGVITSGELTTQDESEDLTTEDNEAALSSIGVFWDDPTLGIKKVNIMEMPAESSLPHQQQGSIRKNTTELPSQEKADEVQSPVLLDQMDESSTSDQQITGETSSTLGNSVLKDENISHKEVRIVILGKTGSGKSATGNTILGKNAFVSKISLNSITRDCSNIHEVRFGRKFVIVDTPGIFDTKNSNKNIQDEISKCIAITSPGPHAFILVLNIASRYTEEEHNSVEHFIDFFGENIYKYLIVLFARRDELDAQNITLFEHLKDAPADLISLINKCEGRVCAFNNKLTGNEQDKQVESLLKIILENVEKNGGKCYTNEMYIEAELLLHERENEKLMKKKEEREKDLEVLKKDLSEEFSKHYGQEMEKLRSLEKYIIETKKTQTETEKQKALLKAKLDDYEQKLNNYRGKEQEEFRQQIQLIKTQLAKTAEDAYKNEQKRRALAEEKQKKEKMTNMRK